MLRILSLVSIALMTFSLTAAPARADEAERVAAHCVQAIQATADKHQEDTHRITAHTLRAIKALDEDGAPDRAIIAVGHRGIKAVDDGCERASNRVSGLADRCMVVLRKLDAPRKLIARVKMAARQAQGSIEQSGNRAKAIIREAVSRAIE